MIKQVLQEIRYRAFTFLLSAVAMIFAVAVVIFFLTTSEASNRETIRLTRDMGFNLRIVSAATDLDHFWLHGFSDQLMPEAWVERFVHYPKFSFAHVTATLQRRLLWRGRQVVLTGLSREIEPGGKTKTTMTYHMAPGRIIIGYGPAQALGIQPNQVVRILEGDFLVEQTLAETGSEEDQWIYLDLAELQKLLNLPGKISEIKALNCLCLSTDQQDPLLMLRDQLRQVLPEAQVIMNKTIAMVREKQRMTMEKYFAILLPVLLIGCALFIGAMAMINVKDRGAEIGILRALGYGSSSILFLFLTRALLLGVIGSVLGFALGTLASLYWGPTIFKITGKTISPLFSMLAWSVVLAPPFAALAALLPAVYAVNQDPADLLREK